MEARVNEIDVMAESDTDRRLTRIEKTVAEIHAALLGNVVDGTPGLVGRMRDRESQAENHDIRITRMEARYDKVAEQRDLDELEDRVKAVEKQIDRWETQVRTAWWIVTVGGGSGIVALASRLIEIFGQ